MENCTCKCHNIVTELTKKHPKPGELEYRVKKHSMNTFARYYNSWWCDRTAAKIDASREEYGAKVVAIMDEANAKHIAATPKLHGEIPPEAYVRAYMPRYNTASKAPKHTYPIPYPLLTGSEKGYVLEKHDGNRESYAEIEALSKEYNPYYMEGRIWGTPPLRGPSTRVTFYPDARGSLGYKIRSEWMSLSDLEARIISGIMHNYDRKSRDECEQLVREQFKAYEPRAKQLDAYYEKYGKYPANWKTYGVTVSRPSEIDLSPRR